MTDAQLDELLEDLVRASVTATAIYEQGGGRVGERAVKEARAAIHAHVREREVDLMALAMVYQAWYPEEDPPPAGVLHFMGRAMYRADGGLDWEDSIVLNIAFGWGLWAGSDEFLPALLLALVNIPLMVGVWRAFDWAKAWADRHIFKRAGAPREGER